LVATGVLTGLPPATTAPGTGLPYTATQSASDLRVTLSATPNQAGTNRLEAVVVDAAGQPVELPQLTLALKHLDMTMDERQAILLPLGSGRYAVEGTYLNMAGRWDGSLGDPNGSVATTFRWTVGDPPKPAPVFSPALILLNAATPVAAFGLVAFGLAALVFHKRSGWQRLRDRRQAVWVGGMLIVMGTLATGNTLATAYRRTLPNPVAATAENIAQGRQLYVQNCAVCHGLTGRGDGPGGIRLNPRPANLQEHMREGHTDPQLFDWVANGVDGTGMPAFKERLSEDQIWTVVNFIRMFGPKQP
jgi:mono/diheme cytochrome c family protein